MRHKFILLLSLLTVATYSLHAQQSQCRTSIPQNYDSTKTYPVIFVLPGMGGGYPMLPAELNGQSFIIAEVQGTESLAGGFDKTIERGQAAILPELARLKSKYSLDTNKIILAGFSLGGDVAFAIALKYPQVFKGIFIMSSRSTSRVKAETIKGLPVKFYFTVGGSDPRRKEVEQAKEFLTKAGISTAMDVIPKMSHMPPPDNFIVRGLSFLLR